jgi:hypothetical protein
VAGLQYTIEARELTKGSGIDGGSGAGQQTVVVARDPEEAIHQYVRELAAGLMSFTQPNGAAESIGIVRKEDVVFLVRVYAA